MEADGFSLDDKRDTIDANDLPDCLASWQARDSTRRWRWSLIGFVVAASITWLTSLGDWTSAALIGANIAEVIGGGLLGALAGAAAAFLRRKG